VNRRIFIGIIVVSALMHPVFGAARLWAHKTWNDTQPGSFSHTLADVVGILS
jgi:hypothetical protein